MNQSKPWNQKSIGSRKTLFNPTHEALDRYIREYLARGGKITKQEYDPFPYAQLDDSSYGKCESNPMVFYRSGNYTRTNVRLSDEPYI